MLETLKEIILDNQNTVWETGIPRDFQWEMLPGKALVFIGVRRCGKSTLLHQIMSQQTQKGVPPENFLCLNFFDDRLTELRDGNLAPILEAYYSLYPHKKQEIVYCFFDEIQEVQGWEAFVNRILRTEKCRVFLTGSSAKMLSKEIATVMRGRSLSRELFPFSFREFLRLWKIPFSPLTSAHRYGIQKTFKEYWSRGGFPEVAKVLPKTQVLIHQEYYKTILLRDVVERHDAMHPKAVMDLGYRLVNTAAHHYSLNRLTEYLKGLGHPTSKEFISSCLEWFEDAYFLFTVKLFEASLSKQNANTKKIYCIDHALIRSVSPGILVNSGHLLENLVFTHLRRHTERIYYYRTKKQKEVDFCYDDKHGKKHLLQVAYALDQPETREREMNALWEAMTELRQKEGTLVVWETTPEEVGRDGKVIRIIPIWKFLLEN